MRDLADPPDLRPEVIWRSLLPFRPERAIRYRIRGAESVPLIVRALTASSEALALDASAALYPDEAETDLRAQAGAMEVLARALWTPSGPAFASVREMAALVDDEIRDLADEVREVLADICPSGRRSDLVRWSQVLLEGAAHPSNLGDAHALSCCVDPIYGGGLVPRPDRYWGAPFSELCCGHWLLFTSARKATER